MKLTKKLIALAMASAMALSMISCGTTESSSSSTASQSSEASESSEAESEASEESSEASESEEGGDATTTPREETLYFGGMQASPMNDINPFSIASHSFVMEQNDVSRVVTYETLYMLNTLDGVMYPLLADGDYVWNEAGDEITVKMNQAALWSDGTPVTANDYAYTYDTHVKYSSSIGVDYSQYIESVTATDDYTIVIKGKADNMNSLKMLELLPKMYCAQKAYIETMEAEYGDDAEGFKTATWIEAPHSGPYGYYYHSDEKVIMQRNDSYWGQDASMWGELPAPTYIAHLVMNNTESDDRFRNGEVDVSQNFTPGIESFWLEEGLPAYTYLEDAPYHLTATMPSLWFNMEVPGLDQLAVRQAIAYAIDYDQIISNAMSNQSPSFEDVPRSLFNPTAPEQEMADALTDETKALQWVGSDIETANQILDDAGIVDTNNDGNREYNGEELSFKVECPANWTDWNAALEVVAAAGSEIGIKIETYFPDAAVYYDDMNNGTFDMVMNSVPGYGVANPWTRAYSYMYGYGGEFPEQMTTNFGRYYNEEVDTILNAIPNETDEAVLAEYWDTLNNYYLTDIPSLALMYRPQYFYCVSETVWAGFPVEGDGTNVPPDVLMNGYGVAGLYNLESIA